MEFDRVSVLVFVGRSLDMVLLVLLCELPSLNNSFGTGIDCTVSSLQITWKGKKGKNGS